ncbi:MAG: hypothetical protein ACLQVX_12175 [Limisphaerales bacterium]
MNIWQQKLLAFLHDPPSKVVDLSDHEAHADVLLRQAGFTDEEERRALIRSRFRKDSDQTASAADRFPFPCYASARMSCAFDGVRNQFHHPLGGGLLRFDKAFESAEIARETDQTIQPVISETSCSNMQANEERWRARFFAHWRLWEPFAVQADYRFGFLPADTRLPDHTIWNHMQVASALAGCAESDAPRMPRSILRS